MTMSNGMTRNMNTDKIILDTIYYTLTKQEQALFNRVMENQTHKSGMLGQLVSESLRRLEKLGIFD